MTRVKRGKTSLKTRRNILKQTKGYRHGRSSKERQAKQAAVRAGVHSFAHRRKNKGNFRRLWQVKISGALKEHGLSYSKFINLLKKKNIEVDRKILAELVVKNSDSFNRIAEQIKSLK
jgi:large subunit ribosomal protein L20